MRIFVTALILAAFYITGTAQLPDLPLMLGNVVIIIGIGALVANVWHVWRQGHE